MPLRAQSKNKVKTSKNWENADNKVMTGFSFVSD